jgi:hypothetical protein
MNPPADIAATEIAALATAAAALIAALAQWSWLIGPRRNGHRARLHEIEARLDASERALSRCIERLHTTRRLWRTTTSGGHSARRAPDDENVARPSGDQSLQSPKRTHRALATETDKQT